MKKLFNSHRYFYAYAVLITISMTAIAACTQVPTKTKECPPTEIIIRGSVQSTGSDSIPEC